MLKKPKAWALTLAAVSAAGCAHSDRSALMGPVNWKHGKAPDYSRAKPAPEPKILPQTYFAAGQLLEQEGHYARAAAQYRKAVAVNHKFVAAYHQLGIVLTRMGALDEATQTLTQASKMAPKNALIHNNLGFALMMQQRWPEAAKQFQQCIELHPEFSRAYINLGMTLAKMDRFDEAYESFRAVLAEPDAYYNLGLMYRSRGRYADAASAFRNALAVNPDFYAASVQLRTAEDSAVAMNSATGESVRPMRSGTPKRTRASIPVRTIDEKPVSIVTPAPKLISEQEPLSEAPTVAPRRQTTASMQPMTEAAPARSIRTNNAAIASQQDRGMHRNEVDEVQPVRAPTPCTVAPKNPVPTIRPLDEAQEARSTANDASMALEPVTPANRTPGMPVDSITETAAATTMSAEPIARSLPRPDPHTDYTIIGPDAVALPPTPAQEVETPHGIPTMTPVDATAVQTTRLPVDAESRSKRTTMGSMITISTPHVGQDRATDINEWGVSEDYVLGVCLADGRDVCDARPLGRDGIAMGTLFPADNADEVVAAALPYDLGRNENRLPQIDSEAIINAFENHIYTFADDDICWDEIDWQSWEVIDPDIVAARIENAGDRLAARATVGFAQRPVERAATRTTSPPMGTAKLITELWTEPNSSDDSMRNRDDLGDFMKFVEMEGVRIDSTEDATPPGTAIEELRTELKEIREEIRCLDEAVSETAKTGPDVGAPLRRRVSPDIDFVTEMNPVRSPIESSAESAIVASEPTALDRTQIDATSFEPWTTEDTAIDFDSSDGTAMTPVRIYDPAGGLPVLVQETPAASKSTRLIAEVESVATTERSNRVDSSDDVQTIIMGDAENKEHGRRSTRMGTMKPIEPSRPAVATASDDRVPK